MESCGCGERGLQEVQEVVTCLSECRFNCYELDVADREREVCALECGCSCNAGCVEACDANELGTVCKLKCGCAAAGNAGESIF